jgi:hypothetical protein
MREFEDKLINHAVDANRPADKLQVSVGRVVEDEVVAVEDAQIVSSDATSELDNLLKNASSCSLYFHLQ